MNYYPEEYAAWYPPTTTWKPSDSASDRMASTSNDQYALQRYNRSYRVDEYHGYSTRRYPQSYYYGQPREEATTSSMVRNYNSYYEKNPYRESTQHRAPKYDELAQLMPGPLAPSPLEEDEQMRLSDYNCFAKSFIMDELKKLDGDVHVMYESVRRFGRFEMREGRIMLDKNETEEDHVEGLSRLWQMGNGYVYVKYLPLKGRNSRRQRDVFMTIFQIKEGTYQQLSSKETEEMIMKDPLWERVRRDRTVKYCKPN